MATDRETPPDNRPGSGSSAKPAEKELDALRLMPWFWAGMALSIPVAELIGNDPDTISEVNTYTIAGMLLTTAGHYGLRLLKIGGFGRMFPWPHSTGRDVTIKAATLATGHLIGFGTIALFVHVH